LAASFQACNIKAHTALGMISDLNNFVIELAAGSHQVTERLDLVPTPTRVYTGMDITA
jgi:hypothetical protein